MEASGVGAEGSVLGGCGVSSVSMGSVSVGSAVTRDRAAGELSGSGGEVEGKGGGVERGKDAGQG